MKYSGLILIVLWAGMTSAAAIAADKIPTNELIVKFVSGSEADQAVATVLQRGAMEHYLLQEITQSLSQQLGVPLQVRQVTSGQEIILAADTEEIKALIERLEQRADIKYVQANRIMQPYIQP